MTLHARRIFRLLARLLAHLLTHLLARLVACLSLSAATLFCPAFAANGDSLEYAVKAAYLYKFGIYVEWPKSAFPTTASPLNLCIAGDDPFGTALDSAVEGQHVDGRTIVIKRVKTVGRDSGCHILYLGATDAQRAAQIVDSARENAILTVSDSRSAAVGMIQFVIKEDRVRFNVDDTMAKQGGLVISSKLLNLALNVKSRAPTEAH